MLRSAVRPAVRQLRAQAAPQLRHQSTSSAQRRFAVYQSQTTNPVVYASLGLAALFGWTAAILTVGGNGKKGKKDHGAKKASEETPSADSALAAPSPEAASPSPAAVSAPATAADPSSQQAAFNPETGEINWDCPCLGGMADGPCGEEFKQAFSCFIFSEVEPKGIDCVDKFRGMQECFRKYPDVYGADDDEEEESEASLIERAEAALALPDSHFLEEVVEKVAEEAPTRKEAEAAASLE
ncbi:hypothetical protein JCM8097_006207 [Rhodosporidiobolus ruineniae]